jgi:hypothetical protein
LICLVCCPFADTVYRCSEPNPFPGDRSPPRASTSGTIVRGAHSLDPTRFDMTSEFDPVWARELMVNGWPTFFPLNVLTDEAVLDRTNCLSAAPPDFRPYLLSEPFMTTAELRSAYTWLLRLIKSHYRKDPYILNHTSTSTFHLFEAHYLAMERHLDFHKRPGVFIEYDMRIRSMFCGTMDEPPLWRPELLSELLLAAALGKVEGTHCLRGYPLPGRLNSSASRQRPAASWDSQSFRPADWQSFRSNEWRPPSKSDSKGASSLCCIGCGRVHMGVCPESAERLYLVRGARPGLWALRPDAPRVCFAFNKGSCDRAATLCTKGSHTCSVCRRSDHSAQGHFAWAR